MEGCVGVMSYLSEDALDVHGALVLLFDPEDVDDAVLLVLGHPRLGGLHLQQPGLVTNSILFC